MQENEEARDRASFFAPYLQLVAGCGIIRGVSPEKGEADRLPARGAVSYRSRRRVWVVSRESLRN